MIYYLQEELFSFDHFDIWDEQDNVCFQVDREFLTWGKTLRVRDAQGRLCATVHHVPFSVPCSFELETADGTLELDRHFSLFSRSYSIDSLGWEVEGDFFGVDYAITKCKECWKVPGQVSLSFFRIPELIFDSSTSVMVDKRLKF